MFAGLERVLVATEPPGQSKTRIYVVGSVANKFNNPVQFRVGFDLGPIQNKWR